MNRCLREGEQNENQKSRRRGGVKWKGKKYQRYRLNCVCVCVCVCKIERRKREQSSATLGAGKNHFAGEVYFLKSKRRNLKSQSSVQCLLCTQKSSGVIWGKSQKNQKKKRQKRVMVVCRSRKKQGEGLSVVINSSRLNGGSSSSLQVKEEGNCSAPSQAKKRYIGSTPEKGGNRKSRCYYSKQTPSSKQIY